MRVNCNRISDTVNEKDDSGSYISVKLPNTHIICYKIDCQSHFNEYPSNSAEIIGNTQICLFASYRNTKDFPKSINRLKNTSITEPLLKSSLIDKIKLSFSNQVKFCTTHHPLPSSFVQNYERRDQIELKLSEMIFPVLSYKRMLEFVIKHPHYEDLFAINSIQYLLKQKKISYELIGEFCIQFKLPYTTHTISSLTTIEVKNQILKIVDSFNLYFDQIPGRSKSEILKQLSNITSEVKYGRFLLKPNLVFIVSYFVKENLKLIFSTLEEVKKIHSRIQEHVRNLDLVLTTRKIQLLENEFEEEKEIVKKLNLNEYRVYFMNRFNCSEIIFKYDDFTVLYNQFQGTELLESYVAGYELQILSYIIELIKSLARIFLFFKNNTFPLQEFGYYEERIVYLYNTPLTRVLEYNYCDKESASAKKKQTINNLPKVFQVFHRDHLRKNSRIFNIDRSLTFSRTKFHEDRCEDDEIACKRSVLALSNRSSSTIKFYGILNSYRGIYAYYSTKVKENFVDTLKKTKVYELKGLILKVFNMIEELLIRNTLISSFDFNCMIFSQKGKLKLIPKPEKEVTEEFWAPELRTGRVSSKSLIYSFGVATKYICSSVHHKFCKNWKDFTEVPQEVSNLMPNITKVVNSSTTSNIVSRISLKALKVLLIQE